MCQRTRVLWNRASICFENRHRFFLSFFHVSPSCSFDSSSRFFPHVGRSGLWRFGKRASGQRAVCQGKMLEKSRTKKSAKVPIYLSKRWKILSWSFVFKTFPLGTAGSNCLFRIGYIQTPRSGSIDWPCLGQSGWAEWPRTKFLEFWIEAVRHWR